MDLLNPKPQATEQGDSRTDSIGLDYYRIVRGQIEHEDNLVGSRISWFVTSQSFLFSAYAIIASNIQPKPAGTGATAMDAKHVLLVIIPTVAILTSVLLLLAICSGIAAMSALRAGYNTIAPKPADHLLPPIHGSTATRLTGMAAPVLLPPLFMAVWIFLLVRRLF
jgi:hypothetical protein